MPLTLTIGNTDLPVGTLADLSALVNQNGASGTVFELLGAALGAPNQQISQFGQLDSDISLSYKSNPQSWNLDGGIFTFGISGGITGTLHVYSPGKDLFSYIKTLPPLNGFDSSTSADPTAKFSVPGGNYYVGISLQLTLDVDAGGSGNVEFVGIKGSADASGTYTFSFFKSVDPNTTVSDALVAAFGAFTLPLHDRTFSNLNVGDSVLHSFKADLKLGMGLSYGITTPSFAQNITGMFPAVVQGLPSANAAVTPSTGLNVSVTASFEYTGSFEAYLWKESDVLGHYHLYRNTAFDRSFGIDVNASLISNASVSVNAGNVATIISGAVPGQTGQVIGQIVNQNTSVQSDLDTAAKDLNTAITNILKPLQSGKAELQASIETTDTKTILLNLTIDLSKPGFDLAAWESLSSGDFVGAIEQDHSGITVDPGSGLEQVHHRKTDFKFTFFNFTGEWSATRINEFSITYEGNNSYAFTDNAGFDQITNINKSGKEIQFYFASLLTADNEGNVTVQNTDFHVNLKSTSNPKFGVELAKFLSLIASGPGASTAYTQMKTIAGLPSATIELDLLFKPTAYKKIKASPNALQTAADEAQDMANYATFALAVWNANNSVSNASSFSYKNKLDIDYDFWALARESEDDQFPPRQGALPNRRGGPIDPLLSAVQKAVKDTFGDDIDPQIIGLVIYAANVAASFMNLSQDIGGIGAPPQPGVNNQLNAWNSLNGQTGYILKNDVNGDYLLPTACALAQMAIAEGAQAAFSAPVLPTAQDPGYKLTVELS